MKKHQLRDSICLLPPSIPGSVGDEKAMRTCVQMLDGEPLIIFNYEQHSWDFVAPNAISIAQFGTMNPTSYYKAHGWKKFLSILMTILHFTKNVPTICRAFLRSKRFIILGMDIMDGHYGALSALHKIVLAYIAVLCGVRVEIINCSFNDHPSPIVTAALRRLPQRVRIVAREKISQQRMEKALLRPIDLAADIVFLFDTHLDGGNPLQSHIDWIDAEKQKGQAVIAMNLADNRNYPMEKLLRACVETIGRNPSISFVLVPHAAYTRTNLPNENVLMEQLLSLVPLHDAARCRIIHLPYDPRALQGVLEHLDFGICGRMHLAIGLLSAGVPACCIGYQNKFDGLLTEYLHMPELLLDMDAIFAAGNFNAVLQSVLPSVKDYTSRILKTLPELRTHALHNFQHSTT